MKPKETLVILANTDHARFLRNTGIGKGLTLLSEINAAGAGAEVPEFSDEPGRSRAAPGMARHGFAPHAEPGEEERLRFARAVVAAAEKYWNEGRLDRIVVAAEPKMLGRLRDLWPEQMAKAVVGEAPKDLLKVPVGDLPRYFEDIILL